MELSPLTALSSLDGRYRAHIEPLDSFLSEFALMRHRVDIEVRWLLHLIDASLPGLPPIKPTVRAALQALAADFDDSDASAIKALEAETNHDVKAVEYFVRRRLAALPGANPRHLEFIHFACTSEDINNLALARMLRGAVCEVMLPELQSLRATLVEMAHRHAALAMLSRTHGQSASPTTLGKEAGLFAHRLGQQLEALAEFRYLGKINGAVGNFNAHLAAYPQRDWPTLAEAFVTGLGLKPNPCTGQIEPHDFIAELAHLMTRLASILTDLDRDFWGYISLGYFRQRVRAGEVGSSTMPHKVNPIAFENSEGNAGLAVALFSHLAQKLPLSRWQRDLSDSTVLRALGSAFGHALLAVRSAQRGLSTLETDPVRIAADLDQAWEVLAEPVQVVMRRHGISEAYEKLKEFSRGKPMDRKNLHGFINSLALPASVKRRLLAMTPAKYVGNAAAQARQLKL